MSGVELYVHVFHCGVRRALLAPPEHLSDLLTRSFEEGFDPSVGEVFLPAGEAELLGLLAGGVAKKDALHVARDVDVCPLLVFVLHLRSASTEVRVFLVQFIPYLGALTRYASLERP